MASNKLFEAAAEILAGSKSKAGADPTQKLEGEVVDLGGPTPQNYKNDDDSAKIDTTKAAKSAAAPTTKPSAASSKMEETESEEEVIAEMKKILLGFLKFPPIIPNTFKSISPL